MRIFRLALITVVLGSSALSAHAETLIDYFSTCETELGFTDAEYDTNNKILSCYDGDLFAPSTGANDPTNDRAGYTRINDNVDAVFACRWLSGSKQSPQIAKSIEMIIHNRQSGKTCFFDAAKLDPTIVPLTRRNHGSFPNAVSWWQKPDDVNANNPCVTCHVAGPYIASPRIAPFMAKYGLLNNGHDTIKNTGQNISAIRYHVVGAAFWEWDAIARVNAGIRYDLRGNNDFPINTNNCSDACHTVATNNPPDVTFTSPTTGMTNVVLPSIGTVQSQIDNAGVMPANKQYDPSSSIDYRSSDYRWVNMDTPNGDGDYETLIGLKQQYPQLYCSDPTQIRAHAVGSPVSFTSPSNAPDTLRAFNARDGLICNNADQADGHACHDYSVQYLCNGSWSRPYNSFIANSVGDQEPAASGIPGVCAHPSAMKALTLIDNGYGGKYQIAVVGPADRLNTFDPQNGLICLNADQGSGQSCSNYVVQFNCDTITPPPAPVAAPRNQYNFVFPGETTFVTTDKDPVNGWTVDPIFPDSYQDTNWIWYYVNGVLTAPWLPLPPRAQDGNYYFTTEWLWCQGNCRSPLGFGYW